MFVLDRVAFPTCCDKNCFDIVAKTVTPYFLGYKTATLYNKFPIMKEN